LDTVVIVFNMICIVIGFGLLLVQFGSQYVKLNSMGLSIMCYYMADTAAYYYIVREPIDHNKID